MNCRAELLAIARDFEQMGYRTEWVKSFRAWSGELAAVVSKMGVADPGPALDRNPNF